MNRHQRRRDQKLSRDASPDEIFPAGHGPVQRSVVDLMTAALDGLRKALGPNYHVTLFVAERVPPAEEARLPRFNYMSTGHREDMLAVLEAFVAKNRAAAPKLDRIADDPPTDVPQ
jgi:hypothetical protein